MALTISRAIFDLHGLVDMHHRELQARWFINRLKAEGCYTITPSYEKIPWNKKFQHGPKWKGSSGSCVNLPLNKAVGALLVLSKRRVRNARDSLSHTAAGRKWAETARLCFQTPDTQRAWAQHWPFWRWARLQTVSLQQRRSETSSRFSRTWRHN